MNDNRTGLLATRRTMLRLLSGSTGMLLLAACSQIPAAPTPKPAAPAAPAATTAPPPASAPTAAATVAAVTKPAAQPRSGGTLRTGQVGEAANLDPHTYSSVKVNTDWLVYDRLISYDENLQAQPMLAESWEISGDVKELKLKIRPGVQFHSGRELTSDDVKYNILRVRNPALGNGIWVAESSRWTAIDTPDKYTVVMKSEQPHPVMFDFLEHLNLGDKTLLDTPDGAKSMAVGTGPFSFVEWAQGQHLTFARNKNYWQSGRPYVDGVNVNLFKNQQALVLQFEGGALDVIDKPLLRDGTRLAKDPAYQYLINKFSGYYYFFHFNVTAAPVDDKKVRQAFNYALDRKRMAETVMLGVGQAAVLPWPSGSIAFDAAKNSAYAFDLDKARALLSEAGASNLRLDLIYPNVVAEFTDFAQIYQSDLAKIGVNLANLTMMDTPAWKALEDKLSYQMGLTQQAMSQLDPTLLLGTQYLDGSGSENGFQHEAYRGLIKQLAEESDLSRRKQLLSQINDILLDESFILPISTAPSTNLSRVNVQGLHYGYHENLELKDAWLA